MRGLCGKTLNYGSDMKTIVWMSVVLALSLVALAEPSKDDDAKAVQGTWKPIKAELGGHPMDDAVLKSISLKLDDGKYEAFVGTEPDRGTYTLDATSKPKGMTVTGTEGPNQGKTFPAIYALTSDEHDGDMLRICYDLSGKERPKEFKSVAGTKLYLVTYRRQKD